MKCWPLLLAASIWAAATLGSWGSEDPVVLVIGGDTHGYLSPCGCTKPMSGGIRKRVSLMRSLIKNARGVVLENGGFISGAGKQDELKAEALAQALKGVPLTAATFGFDEAKLGQGMAISLQNLTGRRMVNTALAPSPTNELEPWIEAEGLLIGALDSRAQLVAGALSEAPRLPESAVRRLLQEAQDRALTPVLMLQGGRADAERLARASPELVLIVYSSEGTPPSEPSRVGNTLLATPGSKGLHVVRLQFFDGKFTGYRVVEVESTLADDAAASRAYKSYLRLVESEGLLEAVPRTAGAAFAGTSACQKCHSAAHEVWTGSRHSKALATLEKVGHAKDPDCVGCHVVGLSSKAGFQSRAATPQLADVGCEACHGPGKAHASNPKRAKMAKVGPASCAPCHRPEHSPNFFFPSFWKKVAHK